MREGVETVASGVADGVEIVASVASDGVGDAEIVASVASDGVGDIEIVASVAPDGVGDVEIVALDEGAFDEADGAGEEASGRFWSAGTGPAEAAGSGRSVWFIATIVPRTA